ncbi:hypothetical protein ACFZCK_22735 [Kitasatospora purpeofusca]|uniref:hypothetical protein n=1 Tax=Kitasatospora purpeofusca TaxID=67352 RepID=UPI0036E89C89
MQRHQLQRPAPKVIHAEKEQRNLAAAAQFRGLLVLADGTTVVVGLGLFIANRRSRRADVPAAHAERLTELGMR